jgi:hypothetical protein
MRALARTLLVMDRDVLHAVLIFETVDQPVRLLQETRQLAVLGEARIARQLDSDVRQTHPEAAGALGLLGSGDDGLDAIEIAGRVGLRPGADQKQEKT